MSELLRSLQDEARRWCAGKNGLIRAPFLLYFAYVLVRHLSDPEYGSVLAALNLGIHELGHLVFSPLGQFMGILGGTLLQLIAPLYGVWNFWKQDDWFSISLCFCWLGTNFFYVARYIADARAQSLPLVSPFGGDTIIHDWDFLLSRWGLLEQDRSISGLVQLGGAAVMVLGLAAGGWLVWNMIVGATHDAGQE